MALIFDCRTTFYTEIPACWEEIIVNIGLPAGDYVYKITTPYGKVYRKEVTVSAVPDGFILVSTDFPDELFNPWIGIFELKMYEADGCTPVDADVCGTPYQSIIIRPYLVMEPPETIYLVCPCVEEEPEP